MILGEIDEEIKIVYQIFTTTWLCKWSGFDSAITVVQSTGKTPVTSANINTDLQISRLKYIFRNGYSVTNYYDSIEISFYSTYFHHGTRWNLSRVIWVNINMGAADRDSETQGFCGRECEIRIEIWAKMGSHFFIERNTTPLVKGRSWCELNISHMYAVCKYDVCVYHGADNGAGRNEAPADPAEIEQNTGKWTLFCRCFGDCWCCNIKFQYVRCI